jgi:hypothetical protein
MMQILYNGLQKKAKSPVIIIPVIVLLTAAVVWASQLPDIECASHVSGHRNAINSTSNVSGHRNAINSTTVFVPQPDIGISISLWAEIGGSLGFACIVIFLILPIYNNWKSDGTSYKFDENNDLSRSPGYVELGIPEPLPSIPTWQMILMTFMLLASIIWLAIGIVVMIQTTNKCQDHGSEFFLRFNLALAAFVTLNVLGLGFFVGIPTLIAGAWLIQAIIYLLSKICIACSDVLHRKDKAFCIYTSTTYGTVTPRDVTIATVV